MSNLLGNAIRSNIGGELSAGVYIGVRDVRGLDFYYLVLINGEFPFLRIGDVISLPSLTSRNNLSIASTMFDFDLRDITLIKKIYDQVTGLSL